LRHGDRYYAAVADETIASDLPKAGKAVRRPARHANEKCPAQAPGISKSRLL
jgi:hypothetical protein